MRNPVASEQNASSYRASVIFCLVAVVSVLSVFFPALGNQFVNLDDPAYVIFNEHIAEFNLTTIWWAFTSFHEGNWHPLTMLSLAIDKAVWGLNPFGYILTNIFIHCITTALVFCLLSDLISPHTENFDTNRSNRTAILSGSLIGTLFFAIHPLRVESVIWISERKDVLCTLFMVFTFQAYLKYSRNRTPNVLYQGQENSFPWAALCFAVLASLAKPTAVSIPIVLCIIDWYPLRLWSGFRELAVCVRRKLPFFIVALGTAVMTLQAQQVAMQPLQTVDLFSRLLVASKALVFYLYKSVWPIGLAAFYPHPGNVASTMPADYLPFLAVIIVAVVLLFCSLRVSRVWFALAAFYVVTITPMIGLVQVGGQWAADRYSYVPSLALTVLVAGLVSRICVVAYAQGPFKRAFVLACCGIPLIMLATATVVQIGYWYSTETLASRIIELQPQKTGSVYLARAIHRKSNGRYLEALKDSGEAMSLALKSGRTRSAGEAAIIQAEIYAKLGRYQEALTVLEWGIRMYSPKPGEKAYTLQDELRAALGQTATNLSAK
jgi:hypothetical protein